MAIFQGVHSIITEDRFTSTILVLGRFSIVLKEIQQCVPCCTDRLCNLAIFLLSESMTVRWVFSKSNFLRVLTHTDHFVQLVLGTKSDK